MSLNPVLFQLGRRIRLAVIGGGKGSFIGPMHRLAARMDDRYELVTGVLSSDPHKAEAAAAEMGFAPDRLYSDAAEMLEAESRRPEGADAVAIMTPNSSHFEYAMHALSRGFDVICDKPMTNTLEEAEALCGKVEETGPVFCLTHNYTGYPMVRQAREMVRAGALGEIRLVQTEYVQGGRAAGPARPGMWRDDPLIGGPSLVMGDIGTHAHNLLRFITGLEVAEVSAEIGAVVPGMDIDDYAGALLRLDNGARGSFWATQAAAGVENGLRIRVSGEKGSLEWMQETPQRLIFKPLAAPAEIRTPNGPGILPLAAHFPTARDGLAGVRFVHAAIESTGKNGVWVGC
jgi:predicted dehydrogenase